jgi:hypothetical protein
VNFTLGVSLCRGSCLTLRGGAAGFLGGAGHYTLIFLLDALLMVIFQNPRRSLNLV